MHGQPHSRCGFRQNPTENTDFAGIRRKAGCMKTVLWWGRGDQNYSRNRSIALLFKELGWRLRYFHPIGSKIGTIQAYLMHLKKPSLIWVPCFRQRDMFSAIYFSKKWGVPLVFDPLTSAYEKAVYERRKYKPGSRRAERMKKWETGLFQAADMVVLENEAYAEFVRREMGLPAKKLGILYNGAYSGLFKPLPQPPAEPPFNLGFVGSFQPSMGTDVIVKAAGLCSDLPCTWILIGEGDSKPEAVRLARNVKNVKFRDWVPYDQLPEEMGRMHIMLGIFGKTFKTEFVIPNKIFEAMAIARPLITQRAAAYRNNIGFSAEIGWVERGNPGALAEMVRKWLQEPEQLERKGVRTRALFDEYFRDEKMKSMLEEILGRVMNEGALN